MKTTIKIIALMLCSWGTVFSQCNDNTHSNNPSDNWESCSETTNPNTIRGNGHWVMYDLGYTYPLTTSNVWNYNVAGNTDKGFKDVVIDYSTDGVSWTELGNYTFSKATGSSLYNGEPGPVFGNTDVRYVLITGLTNYGAVGCFGLAEMKFDIHQDVQVGMQEKDAITVDVYPNPASDIIYLDLQNHKVTEMILRTATGQELQRYTKIQKALDISYLPKGIYFLEFNLEDGKTTTKKFTKM